jgi:dTDP-4-amino-4,6-dideoxygalactose transaminase
MRIGRTLPPAAAPISFKDLISGLRGAMQGPSEVKRFEAELKDYFGVRYCFLVSSGKAALALILRALKQLHPERDEVLIPAFTCYSVPSAVTNSGLKVKLCDVDPETLDFKRADLEQLLSNGSKSLLAVVPCHLFGFSADIEMVRKSLKEKSVVIIEDAAQVMGARRNGKMAGTMGDVGFFSLGRGKALSCVEGGIIVTSKKEIGEKLKTLYSELCDYSLIETFKLFLKGIALSIFSNPQLFWLPKSLLFLRIGDTFYNPKFKIRKMSGFQAGLSRGWRKKLENMRRIREMRCRQLVSLLNGLPNNGILHRYHKLTDLLRFPVRIVKDLARRAILESSEIIGLGVMITYPRSVDKILKFDFKENIGIYTGAEQCAETLITLPIHAFVKDREIEKSVKLLDANLDRWTTPHYRNIAALKDAKE